MIRESGLAVALLLLATAVAGETIYKYRQADGRTVYTNRELPGATLLDKFEHEFPKPAEIRGSPEKSRLEAEERIRAHLAALEKAWQEVLDAEAALALAEERLRAGEEPVEADPRQLSGLSIPASPTGEAPALAPPSAGGPLPAAPPAAGGPLRSAPPAVGGPMGPRHGGGGRSVEYRERIESLESDATAARARLDEALRRYNALR